MVMSKQEIVDNDIKKRLKAIKDLKVSTGDKKRLQKRREIIKSMKFLRQTGKRLRDELSA